MNNIKPNIDAAQYRIDKEIMNSSRHITYNEQKEPTVQEIEKEFNSFEKIDLSNELHLKELENVCPLGLIKEANNTDRDLFMALSRFDHYHNTFVVGCMKNDGQIISYKRRKLNGMNGKWITKRGTHPNNILFTRIFTDESPIYIIEGHRDSLTATLLGLDYIMIPYAGYRYGDKPLLLFKNECRKIIALTEDKPAFDAMSLLLLKFDKSNTLILETLGEKDKKVDLSDFVQKFKTIEETRNELPH